MFRSVGPDVFARADIAQHLLELRHSLEQARNENAPETRRLFYLLDRRGRPS